MQDNANAPNVFAVCEDFVVVAAQILADALVGNDVARLRCHRGDPDGSTDAFDERGASTNAEMSLRASVETQRRPDDKRRRAQHRNQSCHHCLLSNRI